MATIVATAITALVGLFLGLCMVRGMRMEKAAKQHFRSRDPIPVCQWLEPLVDHADYLQAEAVLIRLAQAICLDPMKLRPDDPFHDDAHSVASYCGGDEDFDEAFWDECDRFGRDENKGQNIQTVADYIQFFATSQHSESTEGYMATQNRDHATPSDLMC